MVKSVPGPEKFIELGQRQGCTNAMERTTML